MNKNGQGLDSDICDVGVGAVDIYFEDPEIGEKKKSLCLFYPEVKISDVFRPLF